MKRFTLDRRALLRGTAYGSLVTLALPTLDAMLNDHGNAYADGTPLARRLLTWVWGNGVRLEHWTPRTEGPGYALTEELAPLAAVKSDLTVLSGFENHVAGRRGHHDGMAGLFSGYPFIELDPMGAPYASKFGGPTIDQIAADIIGTDTYFKSLQVGVTKRHLQDQGPTLQTLSHRGPDEPLPMERDPQKLYDKLFAAFVPEDPATGMRLSALDFVQADAQRLRARVGSADRARLDAHLDGVFQLQKQILTVPPSCELAAKPGRLDYNEDGSEPLSEINQAMTELVTMALTCDLTRVVSFMFTGPSGGTFFQMLPPSEFPEYPDANDLSHSDQHNVSHINAPYEQDFIHKSVVFCMENLAVLLERLKNTPEGDGSLLDQMCVYAASDVTEGWAHSENDFPILIAGGAGGRLKNDVGHYRSPDGESLSDVALACLKSVLPDPAAVNEIGGELGTYDGTSTTPCAAIYQG